MSLTNAISGVIAIGGFHTLGSSSDTSKVLSVIATIAASVNVFGGFLVTRRMLGMFRRRNAKEVPLTTTQAQLLVLATGVVLASFLLAFYHFDKQKEAVIQLLYLLAASLFIIALSSLQAAESAR